MHASKRFIGIAAGAGATALLGGLVLGPQSPSGATETSYSFAKPEALDAVPEAVLVEGEQQVVGAAGAGSYVVERVGDHLTIVAASPAPGWKAEVLHNDGQMVKAVFTSAATMVFAVATLDDAGIVVVEAFEKAIPVVVAPPVVEKAAAKAATLAKPAAADAGGFRDHDGWCDKDGDGQDDSFEGAKGDWDGDHDGDWDGDHDGDWDGDRDGKRRHRDGDRDD